MKGTLPCGGEGAIQPQKNGSTPGCGFSKSLGLSHVLIAEAIPSWGKGTRHTVVKGLTLWNETEVPEKKSQWWQTMQENSRNRNTQKNKALRSATVFREPTEASSLCRIRMEFPSSDISPAHFQLPWPIWSRIQRTEAFLYLSLARSPSLCLSNKLQIFFF